MSPTKTLHDLGQSLWLDNITRTLVNSGTLHRYIDEFSVTGLTSNPTIFDHAIKNSSDYDSDISQSASRTKSPEDLFFDLALADLTRAADLFQAISTSALANRTSSSRFQAQRKDCPPSRQRSSLACQSTSRFCFLASNILRRLKPTCAASSGASRPGLTRQWPRSPRSLLAAGMSQSVERSRVS